MGDAVPMWVLGSVLGLFIATCFADGRFPGRWGNSGLNRRQGPLVFWLAVTLLGVMCVLALGLAIEATFL